MTELKPCPFCGGTDISEREFESSEFCYYFLQCNICDAKGASNLDEDNQIKHWNTRA